MSFPWEVLPLLTIVEQHGTTYKTSSEQRSKEQDHFPVSRIVGTHHFELRIDVEREIQHRSPGCCCVTRRHRLKSVVDLFRIAGANRPVIHYFSEPQATLVVRSDTGPTDCQKMGTRTTDEEFDENLKNGTSDNACEVGLDVYVLTSSIKVLSLYETENGR